MLIEIDENSGFCFGVVNAIAQAEEKLKSGPLYCIGDIVHNSLEINRLQKLGLHTINHEHFGELKNCRVLFRAHGEPPSSYITAKENGIEIIDASCPVVLNLQRKIRQAYDSVKSGEGQVVIYGKRGHAEVNALVAQTEGRAIVLEDEDDLDFVDLTKKIILFSQTTKSLEGFEKIVKYVREKAKNDVVVNDTICRKVANRIPQLREFAGKHDVILFVSGEKSSNGKQLYQVCKEVNPRTFFVQSVDNLTDNMFINVRSVGISGATSTPRWVMEAIQKKLKSKDF